MSTYSNRLQPALQNLLQCVVRFFHPRSSCATHISANVCGGRKPLSDAAEYIELFFHPRSSRTKHISADVQRITLNASCVMISGERTQQLYIFCRVTCFTSDFSQFHRCGTYAVLSQSPSSLSLSLRFNSHFPREPALAGFIKAQDDGGGEW